MEVSSWIGIMSTVAASSAECHVFVWTAFSFLSSFNWLSSSWSWVVVESLPIIVYGKGYVHRKESDTVLIVLFLYSWFDFVLICFFLNELLTRHQENERTKDVMIEQRFHRTIIGQKGGKIKAIRDLFPDVSSDVLVAVRHLNLPTL